MVAFTHATGCAYDGPNCEAAAEGNEGLFAKPAPYLVEGVLVVEVAESMSELMLHVLFRIKRVFVASLTSFRQRKRAAGRYWVVPCPP
jgi:hypothetical protein